MARLPVVRKTIAQRYIMSPMDISSHLDFAAAARGRVRDDDRSEVPGGGLRGQRVVQLPRAVRRLDYQDLTDLAAPDSAARFTGPQLTVNDEVVWGEPAPMARRSGAVTMTVLGQPVNSKGSCELSPGGRGTVVDLTGELKVAIPLLGRKLEEAAAPAVMAGFRTQQEVGDSWLAHSGSSEA